MRLVATVLVSGMCGGCLRWIVGLVMGFLLCLHILC